MKPRLFCIHFVLCAFGGPLASSPLTAEAAARRPAAWPSIPIAFERNLGQALPGFDFIARGGGCALLVSGSEALLALPEPASGSPRVRLRWLGARPDVETAGEGLLRGRSHYLLGRDPRRWVRDVPLHLGARCREVYPGTDVVYHALRGQLELDVELEPGSDPAQAGFELLDEEGNILPPCLDASGNLQVETRGGTISLKKPAAWQEGDGTREAVDVRFTVEGGAVRFELGNYDRSRPLVIDPALRYSTYLGGIGADSAADVAVDLRDGMVYVTGIPSNQFPRAGDPGSGGTDVFVAKLDLSRAGADSLIYAAIVGGTDSVFGAADDSPKAIAVRDGMAYVTGLTESENFPVKNALQPNHPGGTDGFAFVLNQSGDDFVFSTYLGGADRDDFALDIAAGLDGSAYVTGTAGSCAGGDPMLCPPQTAFPTTPGSFQPATIRGGAYAAKLGSAGNLIYSTFLNRDPFSVGSARAIAVNDAGEAFVAGSANMFTTRFIGARGDRDLAVLRLNAAGTGLIYGTAFGGSGFDEVQDLALIGDEAVVAGFTTSTNFPVTADALQRVHSGGAGGFAREGYVAVLFPDGSAFRYATYLGGSSEDRIEGVAADRDGTIYVTGETRSLDFPVRFAPQAAFAGGGSDAFAAVIRPDGSLKASTYLGGATNADAGNGVAHSVRSGFAIAGTTRAVDFPTTADAFQSALNGSADAFVTSLEPCADLKPIQAVFNRLPRLDLKPGFSLVAGKDLLVRAFVCAPVDAPNEGLPADAVLCVDGDVETCPEANRFAASLPPADLRVYAVGSHLEAERRAGIDSINFVLAGEKANDLLTPGVHTFDVKVSPAAGGFEELRERFEGQFRQSDRVHLLVVPIEVPDPAGTGSFVAPDPALLRSAADFLKVVYPLDEEEVLTMVQGTAVQATRSRFETNDERFELMRQVHDVRTAYLFGPDFHRAPGRDNVVFAVGVVPSRVGGSDTLGDAGGYSFSRELPGAAIVIDEPGFSSRAVAHEVGHLEGLGDEYLGGLVAVQNPPPRTAAEGDASGNFVTEAMGAFDLGFLGPGTRAVFGPPGPPFRGYMGVNDEPNWTTQVVYEFLYKQLTSIGGGGGGLPEPREAVHIAGSVSKAGELTLDPLLAGLTSADLPLPQGSIYTVQLRDAAGRTLSTFGFDPSFALEVLGADPTTENRYIEVDPSLFGFTVELPQGTETLAVLRGAGTLAEVRRSPSAPEVEITAAAVSLRTLEVTWDARDADGDALAFTVYYSPGGEDLQVVAVRSAERSLRARVGAAPGAGAFVSVHASDGFDFAMDKREIAATAVSRQLPGDCNQDGSLDVSDAVCVLLALFGGGPARLPCGDASASHSANAALLDWQGDGALDLSDAVASLQFLFRGSAPHVLSAAAGPEGCVAIEGCPEDLGCR